MLYPKLIYAIVGALFEVHTQLGPGFFHHVYRRSTMIELSFKDLPYDYRNRQMQAIYQGRAVGELEEKLLVVDDKVLVLPMALRDIGTQTGGWAYLRGLGLRIGVVANFNTSHLDVQVVRVKGSYKNGELRE